MSHAWRWRFRSIAGDIELPSGDKDVGEEVGRSCYSPAHLPCMCLFAIIATEAVQSVITVGAGNSDNRFGAAICCGDDQGAPTVQPSTPSRT